MKLSFDFATREGLVALMDNFGGDDTRFSFPNPHGGVVNLRVKRDSVSFSVAYPSGGGDYYDFKRKHDDSRARIFSAIMDSDRNLTWDEKDAVA